MFGLVGNALRADLVTAHFIHVADEIGIAVGIAAGRNLMGDGGNAHPAF